MEKLVVVVTGASGFIGSRLRSHLENNDAYSVIPFVGNLLSPQDVDAFLSHNPRVDICVHLAGAFEGDMPALIQKNVETTAVIASTFPHHGCKKIILASTGAVYADSTGEVLTENFSVEPSTPYGLSKKFAENVLTLFASKQGYKQIILRFSNVYGAGHTKGVIHKMLTSIRETKKVTIYGDGTQRRDFLHIDDAVQALEMAIQSSVSGTYNISSQARYSINDVVELLKQTHDFTVEYEPAETKAQNIVLSYDKAKSELKYQPLWNELKVEE
jgi:nucleoside-diphosphate-sugar epimerase